MGSKLKVLLLNKWFGFTLGHYFLKALERRTDIDLKTCGSFSGSYIPWRGGMNIQSRYVHTPDVVLPYPMDKQDVDYELVKIHLGEWKPDLIINTSSTCFWREKPDNAYSCAIAIDPHVLNYDHPRKVSDKFFNMQKVYSKEGDIYLPYAYDPTVHYEEDIPKEYDVAMIGLEYHQRMAVANKLLAKGLKVNIGIGDVYDEYRVANSKAKVIVNWSSLNDLNARAFESPMMGLTVMNEVTDAGLFSCFDKVRKFPCDNNADTKMRFVDGAVEGVMDMLRLYGNHADVTKSIRDKMTPHTYDARIQQVLDDCGFGDKDATHS